MHNARYGFSEHYESRRRYSSTSVTKTTTTTTYQIATMTQRDDVQKFEQGRIKVLQEERLHIQKKTFTKWMNSYLQKARMEVEDLFTDLADGKKLLKLLEIISGEKLGKPNNGKMRVHKIENVNKSLAFLHTKVRLESIGAEDIVDGNPRLILGLIWTIILRFQIQEIEIDVDEENESSEKKSAKDALLLWAQRKTNGYANVHIVDFTGSWRSGLGFNALIHSHRPDLFDYNGLQPQRHIDNLNHAFDVANNELGIPPLLDAEDVDNARPDEKSIMTYIASYYHTFARMKNEAKSGRRIAKIINQMMDADKMKVTYDTLTTTLLDWIRSKTRELEDRAFPNSLEGIQSLLLAFAFYRTQEKPPKYKERSEIEALFFQINTQLKELKQPAFVPVDGKLVQDIERSWELLERAEHSREVALRTELMRQERLEQLNYKFERKSILRENFLKEMIQVLSDPRYGSNLAQVDATLKKHEAISADILAREERFHDLSQMCDELVKESYRSSEKVKARETEILERWKQLLELLEKHKINLNSMGNVMAILRDIDSALVSMAQLKADLSSVDTGAHLFSVEELLHKHALQELQVTSMGETERKLRRTGESAASNNPKEEPILRKKLVELCEAFQDLQDSSARRKTLLEDARNFYQFLQDQEEEDAWIVEKQRICQAEISAKDLRGVISLQQKHKLLQDELKGRTKKFDRLFSVGEDLIKEKHLRSPEIEQKMRSLKRERKKLEDLLSERAKQLQDAAEVYQFYADANEADSWLNEKTSILTSEDYGSDEPSAQALLQRHKDLQGELNAYSEDVQSLNAQADRLIAVGISNLDLNTETQVSETIEEWTEEVRLAPVEVWEEEQVEKVEHKTHIEERTIPQVRALYPYTGHGFNMSKGEVMFLLNRSNPDWWSVRKADGTDGFAPANYVVEIEPRVMQIQVRRPEKVKSVQKIKKVKMVKQTVPVKVAKTSNKQIKRKVDDNNSIPKRRKKVNDTYDELQTLALQRYALLEDAVRLFRFYKECDDFEKWIKDKEKLLGRDDDETVEQAKRKFEKFLTDLSANNKRIEALDAEVEEFQKQKHSQIDKVLARHKFVHSAWQRLNKLKVEKERSLEGASSVELYHRTCDEAKDWMLEKMTQLDTAELGPDLKTVQALQRRHHNLERELAPVEEKVNRVKLLANSVKNTYPHERDNVRKREEEINDLWQKVKDKAVDRRNRLENAVGHQIFDNSAKALLAWILDVKAQLNTDNTARDVQTAQNLLKNHKDLHQDIIAHEDEFREVTDLGTKLLRTNPKLIDVSEKVERLHAEKAAINRGWKERQTWLEQCLQLQVFNKEADNIDASTSSHQAFLEFNNLGESLDEVEALLKQHRAFFSTLNAQDERINVFNNMADSLIAQQHYDSEGINDRRNQVLERRKAVKDVCQIRTHALDASKNYQEFCAEVNDLRTWLSEKLKTASDESYRDLSNLERKLQKHEAFERELRSNEGQLRTINKLGQALIAQESYRKDDVARTLHDLNDEWRHLVGISLDKGSRLRQAAAQHEYNNCLEDVHHKLDEIDSRLKNTQVGSDLRSCRDLLKRHELLENELSVCSVRVTELVAQSEEMAQDGHFNSDAVRKKALDTQKRLGELDAPAQQRKEVLAEALKYHKFAFELDTELQWIKERAPLVASNTLGQNLYEAQTFYKKHKKLEAEILGHQPVIDKALDGGKLLIEQNHPEKNKVKNLCENLEGSWQELNDLATKRSQKLELSLKAQQYFFEANEVESWLNEKGNVLSNTDYGRDRDSATKLLTKHKALELELDTYNSIIVEMGRGAQALIVTGHPESKTIAERQATLEHLVRSLQRRAALRQNRLMESLFRHEYFLESSDLERWIAEQQQQAASEDYGQDYEHLLLLQAKFDDFKHRVEAGSERFNQCEDLAQKLIVNENPYTSDIERKQLQLESADGSDAVKQVAARHIGIREKWNKLREQIENRERRLNAAGEIHRFHKDVADALSRIHEKNAILGTDLGRDLNSALSLLRKQESFENELVALEAQLQILVDDGVRLLHSYPSNKAQISQKQELVVTAWQGLKERADLRRDQLQASVDLQKFLAQARDLTSWSSNLRIAMTANENVRSVAGAQALKTEHEALKSEIEAREDSFQAVADMSTAMEQTGHYAATEAVERCGALFQERDKLHTAWQLKKIRLDQIIDFLFFMREIKQIENICTAQEAGLGNTDFGQTVDDVSNLLKKHDAFEKLFNAQEERVDNLFTSADKLISQKHFESAQIASAVADIQQKRLHIKQLSLQKRYQLENALLYAEFVRDVADALLWIAERQKKLETEVKTAEVANLEEKIKELKKHQAFQAEVAANEKRIREIQDKGVTLIGKRHKASKNIKEQLESLETAWKHLLYEVSLRGKGLEEAQDILEFNNQLDKMEAWIRDKEVMVQAGDVGRDYEHCQALQRKLDDVDSDMRVDDTRIKNINALADKLARQGHTGVQPRRTDFIKKWHNLQGALGLYREKLAGALEVHSFNRDVADTSQRINEKALAMEVDDVGRSLQGVSALQRKQEALESEMKAVEKKLKLHDKEALVLEKRYPDSASGISEKIDGLRRDWEKLLIAREKRRELLKQVYTKQKFLSDCKDLELWTIETIKYIENGNKPNSIAEGEALIELHNEKKAEIDGRRVAFGNLFEFGSNVRRGDPEVDAALRQLEDWEQQLLGAWEKHKEDLTHDYQLQEFKEQADQLETWLASKEAFLNNDDLGESSRAVEILVRKHRDFEKLLDQQMNRISDLQKVAEIIVSDSRYDNSQVTDRLQAILERKNRLLENSSIRMQKLKESYSLHEFRRNASEVENWLTQKIQVAGDENYRDPSNLQSKIQKHTSFDAEILANESRIQAVMQEGDSLIVSNHFASAEIQKRLDDLDEDWKHLKDLSELKRDRLADAYQALLFDRCLDEFLMWLDEVETQLKSIDYGRDLATVNNLLKRHAVLENDVRQHTENCETINETAEQFVQNQHFLAEDLQEKAQSAITRFHTLQKPIQARRDLLEASSMLQQFTRDVDDEIEWLKERQPLAESAELGTSLIAVQILQKKHQVLETELLSREPIVAALTTRAANLRSSGCDDAQIEKKLHDFKERLSHTRDAANIRKLRLQDAYESQMFYTEAVEAEAWLNDKRPLLVSSEVGKDEDSAQSLRRKLEALKCEVTAFQTTIDHLRTLKNNIAERKHFDSDNVKLKQSQIESKFQELERLLVERDKSLLESLTYFVFVRECAEMQEWMNDQQVKAASEDYGTDVEHVELLIQAFETFMASLNNSELRVQNCVDNGSKLISARNTHKDQIEQKVSDLKDQWEDLMELAQARHEALAGAKQVHIFDRTADETIAWILEKEATLAIDTHGQDLESIQAMVRKHAAFESELVAVKEQVEAIEQEAQRLSELFPDAEEHIEVKREDALGAWRDLKTKAERRRENLQQAEQLQTYFDQYQDLMAWINEMIAKVTAPDLPQEVTAAELLIEQHKEHKVEIDARSDIVQRFYDTGNGLIRDGHFLSSEIEDRVKVLYHRMNFLNQTWQQRSIIYEQNLDVQLFKREANLLENWLVIRENALIDTHYGDSIAQVEDLIRKHDDFEKTIEAQEEKFIALRRSTLIEEAFANQLREEARAKQAERERLELERLEERKKLEMQRLTELRRLEQRGQMKNGTASNTVETLPSNSTSNGGSTTLTKSNSVAYMFGGNRFLRTQDSAAANNSVKRAESMKANPISKPLKKTPSFTTRRRLGSFRNKGSVPEHELPPVEIQAFLERKQVLVAGGKRAQNRTWKNYWTVLCGQLLCFFKNSDDFVVSKAIASPVGLHNAVCTVADDYYKKKHTFRLVTSDGSQFLFACSTEADMIDWVNKISFRAKLPPSQQLLNLEIHKDSHELDVSSQSSRTSSPDIPDSSVVLRHDPQFQNGNSQHHASSWRHTLTAENPPPLPRSEPPNNNERSASTTVPPRRNTLDSSGDLHGNYGDSIGRNEWQSATLNRPATMMQSSSPNDQKRSSRIMDLFRKKKPSQM